MSGLQAYDNGSLLGYGTHLRHMVESLPPFLGCGSGLFRDCGIYPLDMLPKLTLYSMPDCQPVRFELNLAERV